MGNSREIRGRYRQRPRVSPEEELQALANVYRYILECHTRKIVAKTDNREAGLTTRHKGSNEGKIYPA